jgi:uncharacterized RDD family membrane protein YckC
VASDPGKTATAPSGSLASVSARRRQTAIDVGASLALAILAWPFPLARASLSIPVHVVAVLAFWQIVQVGYYVATMGTWGRTGGLHLMGLRVVTEDGVAPGRASAVRWGALSGLLAAPRLVTPASRTGEDGPAERSAGVKVVAAD